MGIAAGVKCKACGAGGVRVKFMKERPARKEHLCYICSACDYRWFEKPLYLRGPNSEALAEVYEKYVRLGCHIEEPETLPKTLDTINDWLAEIRKKHASPLEKEVEHLENLVSSFTKKDYRSRFSHVRSCFTQSTLRLRALANQMRAPFQPKVFFMKTLDDLEAWVGMSAQKDELIRLTNYKDKGKGHGIYETVNIPVDRLVGILVDYLRKIWS